MGTTKNVYRRERPVLVVESGQGGKLGNCYYGMMYRVTSLFPLDMRRIRALREAGVLGYGQEFYAHQLTLTGAVNVPERIDHTNQADVVPTGHDTVECVEVDDVTGAVIRTPAFNKYSGRDYESKEMPYYVYTCESRVDSSD